MRRESTASMRPPTVGSATFPNSTGTLVKKDDVLAIFYARSSRRPEQNYIYTLNALDVFKPPARSPPLKSLKRKSASNRPADSLRNLGMETPDPRCWRHKGDHQKYPSCAPRHGFRSGTPMSRRVKDSNAHRVLPHRGFEPRLGPGGCFRVRSRISQARLRVKFTLPARRRLLKRR